jgi:hypothetical protein
VNFRTGVDAVGKRKIHASVRNRTLVTRAGATYSTKLSQLFEESRYVLILYIVVHSIEIFNLQIRNTYAVYMFIGLYNNALAAAGV